MFLFGIPRWQFGRAITNHNDECQPEQSSSDLVILFRSHLLLAGLLSGMATSPSPRPIHTLVVS
ncbi:hypothetical protein CBOM_07513 [Ceraceosorus bombacis]|uniref:Uncharacterized protein n=1 Tax=Ceraceosorus bombacis TaxID=401625 RepID=A0A0N7L9M7_9BASI|nr:hypothetical protein CBOM_07513 [Ceraceosorus bombacis]